MAYRRRPTGMVKAEKQIGNLRSRLKRATSSNKKNPNMLTVGSVALGGALPAFVIDGQDMIPTDLGGIPTEGIIGAGLLIFSHQFKGDTKKAVEGLGEGMIAVTAYKLASSYQTKGA